MAKPATAVTEHWVELVQVADLLVQIRNTDAHGLGEIGYLLGLVRKELVQRWVEQANGHRVASASP